MRKTAHEIIDETASFYNLSNRSVESDGVCLYNGPEGKHCAFARMCTEPLKLKETNYGGKMAVELILEDANILKEEYRGQRPSFYSVLQRLHDSKSFWAESGLSDEGLTFVMGMKASFPNI